MSQFLQHELHTDVESIVLLQSYVKQHTTSCILLDCNIESVNFSSTYLYEHLELLLLDSNNLKSITFPSELFPTLECLSISKNRLSYINSEHGTIFNSLRTIRLSHNALRGIPELVLHCPNLIKLDLSYNQIANISDVELDILVNISNLEWIDLSGNPCVDTPNMFFRVFAVLQSNKSIRMINRKIIDEWKAIFKSQSSTNNVGHINMSSDTRHHSDNGHRMQNSVASIDTKSLKQMNKRPFRKQNASESLQVKKIYEKKHSLANDVLRQNNPLGSNIATASASSTNSPSLIRTKSSYSLSSINIINKMNKLKSMNDVIESRIIDENTSHMDGGELEKLKNSIYPFDPQQILDVKHSTRTAHSLTAQERYERKEQLLNRIKARKLKSQINSCEEKSEVRIHKNTGGDLLELKSQEHIRERVPVTNTELSSGETLLLEQYAEKTNEFSSVFRNIMDTGNVKITSDNQQVDIDPLKSDNNDKALSLKLNDDRLEGTTTKQSVSGELAPLFQSWNTNADDWSSKFCDSTLQFTRKISFRKENNKELNLSHPSQQLKQIVNNNLEIEPNKLKFEADNSNLSKAQFLHAQSAENEFHGTDKVSNPSLNEGARKSRLEIMKQNARQRMLQSLTETSQ